MWANQKQTGFTIVELIIVIVVIAVLTVISVVAYNSVQKRAQNSAIMTEFTAWKKAFSLYKAQYGNYPQMPDNTSYCLGTGFPGGKCRDYLANNANTYTESSSVGLMNELRQVSQIPSSPKYAINGTVGPYVTFNQSLNGFVGMTIVLHGGSADCPSGTNYIYDDGKGMLLCEYAFPIN